MFLLVLGFVVLSAAYQQGGGIDLSQVTVVNVAQGATTATRKNDAIPQMNCISGCDLGFLPSSAVCHNLGWTGTDFSWDCSAQMPDEFEFSEVTVSCEGWNGPGDRVIVPDSCGLFFGLVKKPGAHNVRGGGVHMGDLKSLLLDAGKMTVGGEGSQLNCLGGCNLGFVPQQAVCRNIGWDANSRQYLWDCSSQFPAGIEFDRVEVVCQGVSGSGDQNVVEGSCRLDYTLRRRNEDERVWANAQRPSVDGFSTPLMGSGAVIFLAVGALVVMCACCCCRQKKERVHHHHHAPPSSSAPPMSHETEGVRYRQNIYPDPHIQAPSQPVHVVHHNPPRTTSGGYTSGLVHGMMAGSAMSSGRRHHHHHHGSVPVRTAAPTRMTRAAPVRTTRTTTRSRTGGSTTTSSSRSRSSGTSTKSAVGGTRTR